MESGEHQLVRCTVELILMPTEPVAAGWNGPWDWTHSGKRRRRRCSLEGDGRNVFTKHLFISIACSEMQKQDIIHCRKLHAANLVPAL